MSRRRRGRTVDRLRDVFVGGRGGPRGKPQATHLRETHHFWLSGALTSGVRPPRKKGRDIWERSHNQSEGWQNISGIRDAKQPLLVGLWGKVNDVPRVERVPFGRLSRERSLLNKKQKKNGSINDGRQT